MRRHETAAPYAVFRSPGSDALARQLACTGAGAQIVGTRIEGRRLGCYAAVLVDEGTGSLESETAGLIRLEGPVLFFLFPGELHSYGPDRGERWHEQWLLFEGSGAVAFEQGGLIERRRPLLPLHHARPVSALFGRIRDELAVAQPHFGVVAAGLLQEMLGGSRRSSLSRSVQAGSAEAIAAAIRTDAFGILDLGALADRFQVSPATLRRRMLEDYGLSPKAYQLQLRIDRAKELLALGDASVVAVARSVGFDDPYYFSRLFRKREGMAPSRFRAENRRG